MKLAISRNRRLIAWVEDEVVYIVREYYNLYSGYYRKLGYKALRIV
jgi:hypothetical protein